MLALAGVEPESDLKVGKEDPASWLGCIWTISPYLAPFRLGAHLVRVLLIAESRSLVSPHESRFEDEIYTP